MKLLLRDRKVELCAAWADAFHDVADVQITHDETFFAPGLRADAIVSPANSFGFMDGGIDDLYSIHFGRDLQERLQERIRGMAMQEVIVGDAIGIATNNEEIPVCIVAPTMRVPLDVADTANAFLATRAALIFAQAMKMETVLCPGMCTGVGRMPLARCAAQMRAAWDHVMAPPPFPTTWFQAQQRHHILCKT